MQSTLWCARNLGQSMFWKNLPTQRLLIGEEHSCQRRCQEKVITRRDAEFHIAIKCVEAPSQSQTPSRCPDATHARFWMTSSSTSICPMYQSVPSASKTLSKVVTLLDLVDAEMWSGRTQDHGRLLTQFSNGWSFDRITRVAVPRILRGIGGCPIQ